MRFGQSRIKLSHLNPDSHVHILIGPNGSGKSQSLLSLQRELNDKYNEGISNYSSPNHYIRAFADYDKIKVPIITYKTKDNDNVSNCINFDINKMASAFRSEGERMDDSFIDWAQEIFIPIMHKLKHDSFYLLLDELDSGLSFDRISLQLMQLCGIIQIELNHGHNPQVILTANSYELVEVVQNLFDKVSIYWVPTRKEIQVDSYNKFIDLYKRRLKKLKEEIENE